MKLISRRKMLRRTSWLASALAVRVPLSAMTAKAAAADQPGPTRKLKVLVAGGHPGDPEYGCGGTIARLTSLGHEVVLLYLNRGDPSAKTADDGSRVRVEEAKKACAILKARPIYAGQIDGNAVVDRAHYEAFRRILALEQP